MKKMFFAMLAVAVLMVSCKKDGDSSYTLEGQWLTEEEEGTDGFPSAKMLMDIGAKSGAGKMTMATLITETVGSFVEGDLYLIQEAPYTYDKSSGTLTMKHSEAGDEIAQVKFISADKVTITEDGVSIFFTRVKKEYSLKDMKSFVEFEPESDFEITPSKEADWAGGEISFVGNKEIKNLTYDAMTDGVTVSELCPTTLAEDCTLTLGLYLDSEGNPFRPDMIVVDGATLLYTAKQQSIIEFSKKRATVRASAKELTGMAKEVAIEGAGMEQKDWGTLKIDGQNLILNLLASGKHFAVTAREKEDTAQVKDKDGNFKTINLGTFHADGFKDVAYNCKTVLRMFKDDDGVIKGYIDQKDRTMVHEQNEIVVDPSITDWQPAIDKNVGKKDFVVQNNMNDAIEKELKAVEKDNAKFDTEMKAEKPSESATLKTVEDYHNAIKDAIGKLSNTEKSKRQTEIGKEGLPKAYQKIEDIEVLKKYYNIVSK